MAFTAQEIERIYEWLAPSYDLTANLYQLVGFRETKYRRRAVAELDLRPGQTVVELCCGTGLNFGLIEEKIGPTGRLIGVDMTEGMLRRARRRVAKRGWNNVELIRHDVGSFEFPANVDRVISTFALTLVPEFDEVIARARRALSPDGKLVLLDLKRPEGRTELLFDLSLLVTRPFAVSADLADRHPWESVERHFEDSRFEEMYLGLAYIATGRAGGPARVAAADGSSSAKVASDPGHTPRPAPLLSLVAALLLPLLLAPGCARGGVETGDPGHPPPPDLRGVTPVQGPSWLRHLGLDMAQSRMGQMGGAEPGPATNRREPDLRGGTRSSESTGAGMMGRGMMGRGGVESGAGSRPTFGNQSFILGGADLFRLVCRSCHGPAGQGAPPEINSLVGPVQGTSAHLYMEQMKKRGIRIDEGMATELASQSKTLFFNRLENGGKKMPPFAYLRQNEIKALLGYLQTLAGAPPTSESTKLVTESPARVGELLVKGTCHVCHDATGPGRRQMGMMSGGIPSLASFPRDWSAGEVVRQVQGGSSGMMRMMGGSSMPAFPYLTKEEAEAAWFDLENVPPQ